MKRLFLLIAVCMIGMVLPQGVFAADTEDSNVTFTSDGSTITITSTKAGALAGLKFNAHHNQNLRTALSNSNGGTMAKVNIIIPTIALRRL